MRHNRRPVILASALPPNQLSVLPRGSVVVACPDCGVWRGLRRSMISPHRAENGVSRCPGSAQRIRVDITPEEWREELDSAEAHAGLRRRSGDRPADPKIERVTSRVKVKPLKRPAEPVGSRRAPVVTGVVQPERPLLSRDSIDHKGYRDRYLLRAGWQSRHLD